MEFSFLRKLQFYSDYIATNAVPLTSVLSLSSDPRKRPSFLELLDRLRDLQKQYSLHAQMQRASADALLKGAAKVNVEDC